MEGRALPNMGGVRNGRDPMVMAEAAIVRRKRLVLEVAGATALLGTGACLLLAINDKEK